MKKWITLILLTVFLSLVGVKVYMKILEQGGGYFTGKRGKPVAVELARVRRETIRDISEFTGSLKPRTRFLFAAKIPGRLQQLKVDIGDKLTYGQLVAVLDDHEYQQQLEQARALLEVAKANSRAALQSVKISARELSRIKSLRSSNISTVSELDTARDSFTQKKVAYEVAKAQLAEKKASFKLAQIHLSYTRIHAQWRNKKARLIVGERFVDEGTLLSINTPIVSLIDISSLVAVIHVTERDYYKLKVGQPVNITTEAIRDRTMKGRITRIAPVIKESSREATVQIEVSNPGEILKPGLFIRAEIEFAAHRNAVVIPQSALVTRKGVSGVFRADLTENKARFIRIKQGIINNGLVEVLAPKLSGDVITIGHHLLEEGSTIMVPNRNSNNHPGSKGTQAVKKRPQG